MRFGQSLAACAVAVAASLAFGVGRGSAAPTELFFSEYVEGTSFNKAVEVYNGTGHAVDLAAGQYVLQFYYNGATSPSHELSLFGTVANGDVHVVTNQLADPAIIAVADRVDATTTWFNGDDAVVLRKGGVSGPILDVIGQVGFDPGSEWGTGLTSTADNTLRRKPTIQAGDPNGGNPFDPALEWDGYELDTFDGLGSHNQPTAVTVSWLAAAATRDGVALSWRTASELGTLGFNLYREKSGKPVKLNRALIPSVFDGRTSGHAYSWLDRRVLRASATLKYRLQAVHLDGTRSWVAATSVRR